MAESTQPWGSWLERRRRLVFGWLLLLAFLVQNLGIWAAWQAGSSLQTALNVLGGGCTLYLLLSNLRQALSMTTAYRVGASFLGLRLTVELVHSLLTRQALSTVQYQEAALLVAFLVTILPLRASAALSLTLLSLVLAVTVQNGLGQTFEFLMLLVTAGVLHFTAEYGRQTLLARRRVDELERQLVWDPLTGGASRQIIRERAHTFMLTPGAAHLAVTVTVRASAPGEARQALQLAAKTLKPLLRDADSLGRWSDDTLLLLFPHVLPEQRPALLGTLTGALHTLEGQGLLPPGVQIGSAALSEASTPEGVVTAAQAQAQAVAA